MKLKLNQPLMGLDNTPFIENGKEVLLSVIVSRHLPSVKGTSDAPRIWTWAKELNKSGVLELTNSSDIDLFRETIIGIGLSTAVLAQILEIISEAVSSK